MRPYFFIFVFSLGLSVVSGQMRGGFSVRGAVEHDPGNRVEDLGVELYDQDRHTLVEKATVAFDGSFEFRQATIGNFEIRLVDRMGNAIRSEYTNLNASSPAVVFRLADESSKRPSGPVSLSALRHRENRKAMREFQLAVKAHAGGDVDSSYAHLEKSMALDPSYAPAHNQLGIIASARGDEETALREFEKTVQLDPSLIVPHANLAIALFRARRVDEAETEARKAIQLDPNYAKAQTVLELCLKHKRAPAQLAAK